MRALVDMTFGELQAELAAARVALDAADFQERLNDWQSAKDAARDRIKAATTEVDERLAKLREAAVNGS